MHGIIGLIILLVGLQIAWKITAARKLDIVGPVSEPPRGNAGLKSQGLRGRHVLPALLS